jgi:flagellar basal-body rod protein FlgB
MTPRLTDALAFNTQALVLRAERQRVIASNIANADTPGFQARDFDFAQALRAATAAQPGADSGLARGVAQGIAQGVGRGFDQGAGAFGASGPGLASTALLYARSAQNQLDNNTVDMDRERAAFADNAVKYEATLRFVNGQLRSIQDAMKSPSQS